jgi:PAS domain S-box-containing protein
LSLLAAYFISQTISAMVGLWCWERRHLGPGAGAYAFVAFSQAAWTLSLALEVSNESLGAKLFWDNFQFLAGSGWAVASILFVLEYTQHRRLRLPRTFALLSLPFVALPVLAFTDRWLHLLRTDVQLVETDAGPALFYGFGPAVWIVALFGYALYLIGLGLLATWYRRSAKVYRRQAGLVLLGTSIPLLGTVLSLTILRNAVWRDLTPLTFALANLVVARALTRWRLFDLIPVAKDTVVESMPDAVYVVDAQGRVLDLNPAARRMTGVQLEDPVVGRQVHDLFAAWPALLALIDRDDPRPGVVEVDGLAGQRRHIELQGLPMHTRNAHSNGRVIVARDVSERKAAEDELKRHRDDLEDLVHERTAALEREHGRRIRLEAHMHQSQKMEAVGRLASNVAHDFNNMLTVIMGSADELVRDRDPRLPPSPELEGIVQASRQAATLTRQLLGFSRKEAMNPVPLDLNEVISGMQPMLRLLVSTHVEVVIEPDPAIGRVMADPSRLHQVVMNLAVNAKDAMPQGGRITIATSEAAGDDVALGSETKAPSRFVALHVRDTGVGMDRATRERALEPFFTTKEAGKGTGLGLAIVHGIVEQSGGTIDIESAPGHGTTVTAWFPRIEDTPPVR